MLATITAALAAVMANLPTLISWGVDIASLISKAKEAIDGSGAPADQLAAANALVSDLQTKFDARLAELEDQAPDS